jgi:hypothetical protein
MDLAVIAITVVSAGMALVVLRAVFGRMLERELDDDDKCRHCR